MGNIDRRRLGEEKPPRRRERNGVSEYSVVQAYPFSNGARRSDAARPNTPPAKSSIDADSGGERWASGANAGSMPAASAARATHTREPRIIDWDFCCVMGSVLSGYSAIALPTAFRTAFVQPANFPSKSERSISSGANASSGSQTLFCPGAGVQNRELPTKLFQHFWLKQQGCRRIFFVPAITTICATGSGYVRDLRIDLHKGISCKLRLS